MPVGFIRSKRPATLDQVDDQYNDGDHQQNVNETAEGVGADQSEQPEYEQDNENSPKHNLYSFRVESSSTSCREGLARLSHREI
jgi:hypothetical protein